MKYIKSISVSTEIRRVMPDGLQLLSTGDVLTVIPNGKYNPDTNGYEPALAYNEVYCDCADRWLDSNQASINESADRVA